MYALPFLTETQKANITTEPTTEYEGIEPDNIIQDNRRAAIRCHARITGLIKFCKDPFIAEQLYIINGQLISGMDIPANLKAEWQNDNTAAYNDSKADAQIESVINSAFTYSKEFAPTM